MRPFSLARAAALLALPLLLAACAQNAAPRASFRVDKPIYSNAVLDLRALAGDWDQVAAFAHDDAPACRKGALTLSSAASGLAARGTLCLDGRTLALDTALAISGPGRLTPARAPAPLDRAWWLLWADADLRTLVIGTPDGSFGFVLNKGGTLPPDRLTAAQRVLAFNGYDPARLNAW